MRLFWNEQFIIFNSLRNSDQLSRQFTAKRVNPLVIEEVYPRWNCYWERLDLGKFNSPNSWCIMNPGTLPRYPVYSELQLHVASKYSCFSFRTFYVAGGRRLQITDSFSWKDKRTPLIAGYPWHKLYGSAWSFGKHYVTVTVLHVFYRLISFPIVKYLVVYLLSSLYSTPVCRFRHMSYDMSLTILMLKWLRKEHGRSLRMALFCRNM
jgi:hypothetical protein